MCKVLALTNLKKITVNYKFMAAIKTVVCCNNQDGFGYAISTGKELFGERYTNPRDFKRLEINKYNDKLLDMPFLELPENNSFGEIKTKNNKCLIAHGRTSTNAISLKSTHPFTDEKLKNAFIHNGVIDAFYPEVYEKKYGFKLNTNNDSELLAKLYWNGGIDVVSEEASGYYAFINLTNDGHLYVARDNMANLHMAWIPNIESFIICTTSDMIHSICKIMRWDYSSIFKVDTNSYFHIYDNTLISSENFESLGYSGGYERMTKEQRAAFKDYYGYNDDDMEDYTTDSARNVTNYDNYPTDDSATVIKKDNVEINLDKLENEFLNDEEINMLPEDSKEKVRQYVLDYIKKAK